MKLLLASLFSIFFASTAYAEECNKKVWSDAKAQCALAGRSDANCKTSYYMAYASRQSGISCAMDDMQEGLRQVNGN
jgi:hypothetical protein